MLQKIKNKVLVLSSLLLIAVPAALSPALAHAAPVTPDVGVCEGASNLQLGTGTNNAPADTTANCSAQDQTNKVNNIISLILNVFSVVVGIIAVIMIIYAGFKYITSGGKDESVKTAKNTILYAVIGLIIVALAQIIVKFVLSKATGTSNS